METVKSVNQNYQFQGNWIKGKDLDYGRDDYKYYLDNLNQVIKKEFIINEVQETYLYIGTLGYSIVYLNGQRINSDELNCDWTNFKKCVYYDVYKITSFLKKGVNIIEVELGNGMYNPAPLKLFGKYNLRTNLSEIGMPRVIVDLVSNHQVILSSDQSWLLGTGNCLFNNLYLGETVNNNLEKTYYGHVEIDDTKRNLVLSEINKIKRCGDVDVKKIIRSKDGLIIDFGEMMSGFINLEVQAVKDQVITITYSERTNNNELDYTTSLAGSVGQTIHDFKIDGGTGCPIEAIQTDRIICKQGTNHFTNKFTYHSFRYALIKGIDQKHITHLYATYVHTDLKQVGKINIDNRYYQELYDSAIRTKLNNVHSTFEDCARERLGYGGDMVALATSNLYTFDLEKFYCKIIRDFRFDQSKNGGIPETAPYMGIQSNGSAPGEGPILWQFVYPYLVYKQYQYYGNIELLQEEHGYLTKQLEYLLDYDLEQLVECCLGDHGSILIAGEFKRPTPDKLLLGYCTILLFLKYNILINKALDQNVIGYEQKYLEIKELIITKFKNPDGSFGDKTQSGYAFAIALELDDPRVLCKGFVDLIVKDNYIFNSGIFGMALSYELLNKYGYDEVIEKWLVQEGSIGFKAMLNDHSGALAELFVGEHKSLNHAMFASYQQWYYQGLAGIKIDDDAVAFNQVTFCPYFSTLVNNFECHLKTKQGMIVSSWQRNDHHVIWKLSIPENLSNYQIIIPGNYQELSRKTVNNNYIIDLTVIV